MATKHRHAETFPPGEFIRDEMDARQWTQIDLADVLGVSVSHVNELLNARVNITADIAKGLDAAFGMTPEFWANLDSQYRLAQVGENPERELRGKIYNAAPVTQMIKRGWLLPSTSAQVLATFVAQFLGVANIEDEPAPFAHAAKKMSYGNEVNTSQLAWLCRVKQLAPSAPVDGRFNAERTDQLVRELRSLAADVDGVRAVPPLLARYGIRFLVVENLPGGKIDGVAFWLSRLAPVIALSLRLGRLDNFWQALLHELKHVIERDGEADIDVDFDDAGEKPERELAANRFAVETLIPPAMLTEFRDQFPGSPNIRQITEFAQTVGVHRCIAIAQLAYQDRALWQRFGSRSNMPVIRELVRDSAYTDGWGTVLQPQEATP